jgi:hypothetical protein
MTVILGAKKVLAETIKGRINATLYLIWLRLLGSNQRPND